MASSPDSELGEIEKLTQTFDTGLPCNVGRLPAVQYASDDENSSETTAGDFDNSPQGEKKLDSDPGPPPDGGLDAWLQVLAGIFGNALTWGYTTTFGLFQNYYVAHLPGHTASEISWIGSTQTFLLFFVGTFSGRAADAGHTRIAVLIGSLLVVFGVFMTSLATEYWQIFLAQGVCIGVGGGIMFTPVLAVVSSYFSKNKAFAVGTSAAGTGVGGVVFPAIVQYLIPKIGYPWAVRCMGFISLFFAIVMNLCLKPRLPPRRSGPLFDFSAFGEWPYVFYATGAFLIFWALFVAFSYINLFARERFGFSDASATELLIVMNVTGIPARLIATFVADRFLGSINTMIPASACLSLMLFCWTAVSDRVGLWVFAVFYGFFVSATQGLFASSLASVTDDLSKIGVRMGMVFTIVSFSSLTGNPIAGSIVQLNNGNYVGAQVWAGCMVLAGCLSLVAARISKTGLVLRKRF